jgi:hypothetical protein
MMANSSSQGLAFFVGANWLLQNFSEFFWRVEQAKA